MVYKFKHVRGIQSINTNTKININIYKGKNLNIKIKIKIKNFEVTYRGTFLIFSV
jgi:hypothetical protein